MQRRTKCKVCGLTLRLAHLPFRGATWVHAPGDTARHNRSILAAEERERVAAARAAKAEGRA